MRCKVSIEREPRHRVAEQGRNEEARYAFEVLGPSAAAVVPELIEIYERNVKVLDVPPPPTDVSVSALCVIADGKVVLCARDNNRNEVPPNPPGEVMSEMTPNTSVWTELRDCIGLKYRRAARPQPNRE